MTRLTDRDEWLLNWFGIVRVSNMEGLRWAMAAANGWSEPVVVRRAQLWCTRMEALGTVSRTRLFGVGGSLVWATSARTGRPAPNLLSQMTRHEVAVSVVSARYAAAGYGWQRDRRAQHAADHQSDGLARGGDVVDAVEVELTPKRAPRYRGIFQAFQRRMEAGELTHVTYLCTDDSARAAEEGLRQAGVARAVRERVRIRTVFDGRGAWEGDRQLDLLQRVEQVDVSVG